MSRSTKKLLALTLILVLLVSGLALPATAAPPVPVTFTILHTNDFHGQLEASGSNPGMAKVATVVNDVRTAVGAANVLLVDAGDEMQGSLLSNLGDGTATGKGMPTIATYNAMGYNVATFGNHEFDWGQVNLSNRTGEATYPYVSANIVVNDTGNCATAGWTTPSFIDGGPYQVHDRGHGAEHGQGRLHRRDDDRDADHHGRDVHRGPLLQGPERLDPPLLRRDEVTGRCHRGSEPPWVSPTAATATASRSTATRRSRPKLNTAGKPANLIIGGHSHTNLSRRDDGRQHDRCAGLLQRPQASAGPT